MTQKIKILGVEQGITITRPFSSEMYDHNDRVREIQNEAVISALEAAFNSNDIEVMRNVGKAISGYGYGEGYGIQKIYTDARENIESSSNNWMREDIWPDFLKMGLVQSIDMDYVGYKK